METAPHTTRPGAVPELVLGRYRLGRRLGSGGMGTVHVAHDEQLDRAVAVKRIAVGDPAIAKRATREGKAAARVQHPGIVALYEAGREGDTVYLVSELVRGHTLRELLDEGAFSDRDVLLTGVVLCDALAHAHARGIVHRDVKPGNILVPARPGGDVHGEGIAKLTDFGVAWMAGDDALTRTGDLVGTLAYMAPEQAEGGEISPATDLYALALVLYEALCGVNPVRGMNPARPAHAAQTVRRIGRRMPALGRLRRDLPLPLCAAIDRGVRPHPEDRGTVEELRDALRDALDDVGDEPGTIAAPATERLERAAWGGRHDPWEDDDPSLVAAVRPRPSQRVVAGLGAGVLLAAAVQWLGPAPFAPPLAVAAVTAVLVALLPRLGWLAAVTGLLLWLTDAGAAGTATYVVLAALPVALLARRAGAWWSLPAFAPGLGLGALALAYPTIAGQAPRPAQRFVLGLLGCWWLLLAETLSGERLLFGATGLLDPAVARAPRDLGTGTVLADVAWPVLSSGLLLVGVLWGLAAAVLPLLVRGRVAAVDLVAATVWAAALATGTQALGGVVHGFGATAGAPEPRGLVAGAVLAAVLAVAVRAVSAPSRSGPETRSLP
ncbi:protein kinase [Conexibacter sp. W3-3-2]|uniref:serine/threonine-protein kinase n=1 Tax=Conexibacter sp. W3-3-2 TaxID=2675227 RepID=UPI0012B75B74|nr:serine/threonine-protein kinase [Conexibacter sp. W3-3-2]MTD45530.1 protein kinase [Conexibacter sp. W3-3-2]